MKTQTKAWIRKKSKTVNILKLRDPWKFINIYRFRYINVEKNSHQTNTKWIVCWGTKNSENSMTAKPTCEKVGAGLPELHWLFIEFARASTWRGHKAVPHGFDSLLAVWIQKEDDRIPLCVVQSVHGFRSHIEKSVTVLRKKVVTLICEIFLKKNLPIFCVPHLFDDLSDGI